MSPYTKNCFNTLVKLCGSSVNGFLSFLRKEYDYESYSNLIDVYIKDLRKKIDLDPNKKFIQTIRGVGYVFKTED